MKLQRPAGSEVAIVEITGNPKDCEPESVRIRFPGGSVDVTRAREGAGTDYWVHLSVTRPESAHYDGECDTARIIDARIDEAGKPVSKALPFKSPAVYHVAFRVSVDP